MSANKQTINDNKEGAYRKELVMLTKNAGITASGFLILNILSFVSNAMITRYLGADDYGLLVLATRILDFVVILASLGFATTIVRHVAFYFAREDHAHAKGTILYSLKVVVMVSLAMLIIFFLLSPLISERAFFRPEISPLLRILLLSLPFALISMVYLSALNGLKKIQLTVVIKNIITPAVFTLLVGAVIVINGGLTGLMWIYIITVVVTALLAWKYVNKEYLCMKTEVTPVAEKRKLWNFSYPLLFIQLLNNTVGLVPIFIIGFFLPSADIGIFNVGLKIAVIVSFSLNAFSMIFSPVMAELFSVRNQDMISRLYKTVTKWTFTFSLVVFFIIILFPRTLLSIFGEAFTDGIQVLIFIAFGELINSGAGLVGSLILMSGRPKVILVNSIFKFALIIVLCMLLVPRYGLAGAGISVAISQVTINLVRLAELYHLEKIHPFKRSYYKPLLSAFISYVIIFLTISWADLHPYLELVLGTVLFLLFFVLFNWMFRLDSEDRFLISKLTGFIDRR